VVRTLKANKLIDEADDAAAAVAKLPEVVRKASAAATSTDAKKAAEALVRAQKDLDTARAETEKAEAVAKKAADEATTLRDRLATQVKKSADDAAAMRTQMDAAVKKATDAATADARKQLDALSAQLTAARDDLARRDAERADALRKAEAAFAAKLAAREEDHRRQLADARSGVLTPLTTAEVAARERASQEFDAGVRLFFDGRHAEAEAMLERATRNDAADARYWYYLALAQALQRKPAEEALKKGADLEARNQPGRRALNDALEPLPGAYRQWLSRYRP
jgi:colicin import membrane protein